MRTSVNGWPVIDHAQAHKWVLPGTARHLVLAPGPAGFVLAWLALWFHQVIDRLDLGTWDEWGHALRPVRGQVSGFSNHASGTAIDLNATRHPQGVPTASTFTPRQARKIRNRMRLWLGCVRWGGDYQTTPDGMHFEINAGGRSIRLLARWLRLTRRGRRILAANPNGWNT